MDATPKGAAWAKAQHERHVHALLTVPGMYAKLIRCESAAERLAVVRGLKDATMKLLAPAIARVPIPSELVAFQVAAGVAPPAWRIDAFWPALEFYLHLKACHPTPAEATAARLLLACIAAEELGDVVPMAAQRNGAKFRRNQGRGPGEVKKLIEKVLPGLQRRLGRKPTAAEVWNECARKASASVKFKNSEPWGEPHSISIRGQEKPTLWVTFRKSLSEVRKDLKTGAAAAAPARTRSSTPRRAQG